MTRAGGLEQVTPRASLRRLPAWAMLVHTQLPSVWPLEWVGPGGVSEAILPCSPAPHTSVCRGRDQAPAAQAAPGSCPQPPAPQPPAEHKLLPLLWTPGEGVGGPGRAQGLWVLQTIKG